MNVDSEEEYGDIVDSESEDVPDLVNVKELSEIKQELTELTEENVIQDSEYECSTCKEIFVDILLLKIHEMVHSQDNYCFICKKTLAKDFLGHISRMHFNHICPICKKVFTLKKTLQCHINYHTGEKAFKCKECDKSFKQSGSLKTHVMSAHEKVKAFKCQVCDGGFTTSSSLKKHIKKMHTVGAIFECHICCKPFPDKHKMVTHEKSHNTNSRICEICGKIFAQTDSTTKHLMIAHYNNEQCPHCPKKFHRLYLQQHIFESHQPKHCDICNIEFDLHRSYARHMLIHEEAHVCKLCNKRVRMIGFARHMKLHEENKIHRCELCNVVPGDIEEHNRRVHKNTKFHFCTACSQKFETKKLKIVHYNKCHKNILQTCCYCRLKILKPLFIKHMQTHHPNAVLRCRKCGEIFQDYAKFESHVKKHPRNALTTVDKRHMLPYKCNKCGKSFREIQALNNHKCLPGIHHCVICDIKYNNKRYYKRHMINFHSPSITSETKLLVDSSRKLRILKGKRKRFQCNKCLSIFIKIENFNVHFCLDSSKRRKNSKKLSDRNRNICNYCGMISSNKQCLRYHITRSHLIKAETSQQSDEDIEIKSECVIKEEPLDQDELKNGTAIYLTSGNNHLDNFENIKSELSE